MAVPASYGIRFLKVSQNQLLMILLPLCQGQETIFLHWADVQNQPLMILLPLIQSQETIFYALGRCPKLAISDSFAT